jgi:hypothetical protein
MVKTRIGGAILLNRGCGAFGPSHLRLPRPLPDMELDAGLFLQVADDAEEIASLWIAARAEHANEALRLRAGRLAKLLEADRRLDLVAQDRLAGASMDAPLEPYPRTTRIDAHPEHCCAHAILSACRLSAECRTQNMQRCFIGNEDRWTQPIGLVFDVTIKHSGSGIVDR